MAILQQIKVPLISVNDTILTIVDISFVQGAPVKKGETILVFETSKTTYDVVAEADGFIGYLGDVDCDYEVNELVANVYSERDEVPDKIIPVNKAGKIVSGKDLSGTGLLATWHGETLFSPAAIQMIELKGLPLSAFEGKDFVSIADVIEMAGINNKAYSQGQITIADNKRNMLPVDLDKVIVKKLTPNKKREIAYLSEVQSTGLTSTIHVSVSAEGIFVHMNQSLRYLKNSLLPVIIYESARLLQKYQALNAYFTGDAIAFYKEVNVGFAIDIDNGLKVLKIDGADGKDIANIEQEILDLSNKYLDDGLQISDLTDIGFAITDLSAEGVAFFKPLINTRNSAILGVSAIDEKEQRMILSLTFDHRVTEGKLAARFLQEMKQRIESYQSIHSPLLHQSISCFKCFKSLADDLSDVGFAKCITPKGEEAYICQSCLKGF